MGFNASVIKDAGGADIDGARVGTVTAQGTTCLEIVAQDTNRDGVLIMNRSLTADIGITLIANPEGKPNADVITTATAWGLRIARIAPNTTEKIDIKAQTRVLISAESTTPQVAWQEVNE